MIEFLVVGAVCFCFGWVYRDWEIVKDDFSDRVDRIERTTHQHSRALSELKWRMDEYHGED